MTQTEIATLAGGCFWCLEAVFADIRGVKRVNSGYAGGRLANPSYELVCGGTTGHAEVVQVTFDPDLLTFRELLDVFFAIHDPTTLNRQGNDVGSQYRSAIFYHSPEQKAEAERAIAALEVKQVWSNPVVTEVTRLEMFYAAEEYHREFYRRNPGQPYCQIVVAPKVEKARKLFPDKLAT